METGYSNSGGGSGRGSGDDDDRNFTNYDKDRMNRQQNKNDNDEDWSENGQENDIHLTDPDNATPRMIHVIIVDTPRADLTLMTKVVKMITSGFDPKQSKYVTLRGVPEM